mgnify:FL=1
MQQLPKANEIYRHFKGNLYRVITIATHTETREKLVIYQALYGDFGIYARELSMFMSRVDRQKYPDASQEYRFELVPEIIGQQAPQQRSKEIAVSETSADPETKPQSQAERMTKAAEPEAENEEAALDSRLLAFLDADTYREKLNLLVSMRESLTDDMVNTMAVSLDVEVNEGAIEERYDALKNCLLMLEKYECSRLRQ